MSESRLSGYGEVMEDLHWSVNRREGKPDTCRVPAKLSIVLAQLLRNVLHKKYCCAGRGHDAYRGFVSGSKHNPTRVRHKIPNPRLLEETSVNLAFRCNDVEALSHAFLKVVL